MCIKVYRISLKRPHPVRFYFNACKVTILHSCRLIMQLYQIDTPTKGICNYVKKSSHFRCIQFSANFEVFGSKASKNLNIEISLY